MYASKIGLRFLKDESGAVTVDWVVLTAALVLFGAAAVAVIRPGLMAQTTQINTAITNAAADLRPAAST